MSLLASGSEVGIMEISADGSTPPAKETQMANGADTEGLARARAKEKNNQQDAGARSGHAAKKLGPLASANHNPKKGGGINRSLNTPSGGR